MNQSRLYQSEDITRPNFGHIYGYWGLVQIFRSGSIHYWVGVNLYKGSKFGAPITAIEIRKSNLDPNFLGYRFFWLRDEHLESWVIRAGKKIEYESR